MNKIYLTWSDIDELVNELANQIKSSQLPQCITGLPRGGLIPAVILSHKLNIPFISIQNIELIPKPYVLIVDDIADSGETLSQYTSWNTAVLHYKLQSEHIPTYYVEIVPDDVWLCYPWERDDSESIQDYLKNDKK
jgi:hypoxanthine phosphoribosyltransferase